VEYIFFNDKR